MPVQERHIKGWDHEMVPQPADPKPQPKDPDLPRNFCASLWVGPKKSGKTQTCIKLLKRFETSGVYLKGRRVSQRIILLSPTVHQNRAWSVLKYLDPDRDVFTDYTDAMLADVISDIEREKRESLEYQRRLAVWKKAARAPKSLTQEEYAELELMHWEPPEKPRFPDGPAVNHVVCDDMIGTSIFKQGRNPFTQFVALSRHLLCNVYVLIQHLKGCNTLIRHNSDLYAIWKFGNLKMALEDIYPVVSGACTPEEFAELYTHATGPDHSCLVYDSTQPKERRFKQNFDKVLSVVPSNEQARPVAT